MNLQVTIMLNRHKDYTKKHKHADESLKKNNYDTQQYTITSKSRLTFF